MARKIRENFASDDMQAEPIICPLCERVIPDDQMENHHLVPKSKGGKLKLPLHRICHSHIHRVFTDAQLAKKFSTIAAILEDPAIQKFVTWVKTKPPSFEDEAEERTRRR
ncbi:HNH endonuclease [Agrobacterium vitis]|uniref:HNH endonuclease n=1 Tax=Agrobacterium vitis TaxID=373 RepID=A0AAE4WEW1_AGRVI|nr:HNH endonuclease [Agrobacterium vitis]MCF1500025.1 HNH endonuclease [Allorhizobium sp. Av2]MCM2442290.1 HNH endonuclease [Agrobacterium vitis]MUZ58700.1 HNH endonuclease [Agrobacterium vitis]MVA66335.1 HNH endonuclease [Agrobacterium vitis]MVA88372.1 HNH endonuclease [Agrobacterium vitis]